MATSLRMHLVAISRRPSPEVAPGGARLLHGPLAPFGQHQREVTPAADRSCPPAPDVIRGARGETGPGPAPSLAVTIRPTALAIPPGDVRSPRAVKLAFLVWLVGDKAAMDVTAKTSLSGLAGSKGGSALGEVGCVGAVLLRRRGVAAATVCPFGLEGMDLGVQAHGSQGGRKRGGKCRIGHVGRGGGEGVGAAPCGMP